MKKFLSIVLGLLAVNASAATYIGSNLAASTNIAATTTPIVLTSIQLSTTNDTPVIVEFLDGGPTTVIPQYTSYSTYTTNLVNEHITSTGTTNVVTNTVVYVYATVNDAVTNETSAKITLMVDKYNPVTFVPPSYVTGVIFSEKLTLQTSAAGVNAVVRYRNP